MSDTSVRPRERPILFTGENVRRILEGRKTQTRRVIRPQPDHATRVARIAVIPPWATGEAYELWWSDGGDLIKPLPKCPYGKPGDRLYVRETWGVGTRPCPHRGWRDGIEYRADVAYLEDERDLLPLYTDVDPPDDWEWDAGRDGWRPSIHMPKWAARLWLEVTAVGVERLQEISEEDARAEGVGNRAAFATLWDEINGKRDGCAWDDNPWVWAVSFRPLEGQR